MSVENEFFPVIAGELGTSVETVKHYEKRLDEFSPVFQVGLICNCFYLPDYRQVYEDGERFLFPKYWWLPWQLISYC